MCSEIFTWLGVLPLFFTTLNPYSLAFSLYLLFFLSMTTWMPLHYFIITVCLVCEKEEGKIVYGWKSCKSKTFRCLFQENNENGRKVMWEWDLWNTDTSRIRRVRVGHMSVPNTDTTPTLIITFNYVFFSNYYQCRRVSVRIVSGVRVCVRAS
jgi:hypothetical protein